MEGEPSTAKCHASAVCTEHNPKRGQAKLVMSVILHQTKERSHNEGSQGLGAERDIWA